jgi:WD40 repeat protein/tRNA A-37 threonylcarbamoyl transferase component Bud32
VERAAANATAPAEEGILASFGDYELVRLIARGGMGIVYKARQKTLNRTVALKMILGGNLASPDEVQRFKLEAEAAAQLEHPGIVPIHEVGEHAGQHYFSMGYVEGGSLATRLKKGPLPPREAASLMRQVALSVEYAHRNNIIHRDIKPANILLDKDGNPKVSDFGLAKGLRSDSNLTIAGQVVGTASYMPPEQASAKSELIGPVSDVYSLGATLYCLLTGRPPFQSADMVETLKQVVEQEAVSPRQLNAAVDRDLETICLKCLQKEPARRYHSAAHLADDLDNWLAGRPITARPVTQAERAWRWCRRNPAVAVLTAAVVVLLIGGTVLSMYLAVRALKGEQNARDNERLAEERAQEARLNEARANAESQRAREAKRLSDLIAYASSINSIHRAWKDAQIDWVEQRLDELKPKPGEPDLRSFEWYYLEKLCRLDRRTIVADQGAVWSVAYGPGGQRLVSAGQDGTVKVWDTGTGRMVFDLRGHNRRLWSVACSRDNKYMAAAGGELVKIWNARTGSELRTLPPHLSWCKSVAFLHDNTLVSADGQLIRFWDPESGKEIRTLRGHQAPIWGLAVSSDGHRLATATGAEQFRPGILMKTELKVWDPATGQARVTLTEHTQPIAGVALSPDGQFVASVSYDHTARVWDANTGSRILLISQPPSDYFYGVAFCADGRRLALADQRTVRFWDLSTGETLLALRGHRGSVLSVAFDASGTQAATGSFDGTVKLWDLADTLEARSLPAPASGITSLAFSRKNERLVSGQHNGTIAIWDARQGKRVLDSHRRTQPVLATAFNRDDSRVAAVLQQNGIEIWDPLAGKTVSRISPLSGPPSALALNRNGERLATANANGDIEIWDATTGQRLAIHHHDKPVSCLVFSDDNRWIACADEEHRIVVLDAGTGEAIRQLTGHHGHIRGLAFSPDTRSLASASTDRTVRVWFLADQRPPLVLRHSYPLNCVALSPDGHRLATSSAEYPEVKIWDLSTGQEMLTLTNGLREAANNLTFSEDGLRLAAASGEAIIMWETTRLPSLP